MTLLNTCRLNRTLSTDCGYDVFYAVWLSWFFFSSAELQKYHMISQKLTLFKARLYLLPINICQRLFQGLVKYALIVRAPNLSNDRCTGRKTSAFPFSALFKVINGNEAPYHAVSLDPRCDDQTPSARIQAKEEEEVEEDYQSNRQVIDTYSCIII